MKRPRTVALTLLLSFLSTLGPFSLDMYLPSLPDIGLDLHASTLRVQLTISSYLFGSAIITKFFLQTYNAPKIIFVKKIHAASANPQTSSGCALFLFTRRPISQDWAAGRAPLKSVI